MVATEEKLPELVEIYRRTENAYALRVLISVFQNALEFSRPIPAPMVSLVREWVAENGGPKRKKAANQAIVARNDLLVAGIQVLVDRAGIAPTRNTEADHAESGCDLAAEIWNKIAAERKAKGVECPTAT